MKYDSFRYIFPPRPQNACPPSQIKNWDDGMMMAQPKINGSNCIIFMDESSTHVYNRHGDRLSNFKIELGEIRKLYRGSGWMVLNGEYLNKNKKDENRSQFNEKLVLFDILVYNGDYMVGKSFQDRLFLMEDLFLQKDYNLYLTQISDSIFRVKTFDTGFQELFEELTKIELVEGLVLKRKNARLEIGNNALNNTKSQVKFRKPTKNYKF